MGKTFTTDIEKANSTFNDKLYFIEDIEKGIEELKKAKADNIHTKRENLNLMLRKHGVECTEGMSPSQYSVLLEANKNKIPSLLNMPEYCFSEMIKVYKAYKTPGAYIERIVNNCCAAEYNVEGTSVRLKILKQILGKLNYLKGTRLYDETIEKIVYDKYNGRVENIDENIFGENESNHIFPPNVMLWALLECYSDILYLPNEKDEELCKMVCEYDKSLKEKCATEILGFVYEKNHRDRKSKKSYYDIYKANPSLTERLYKYIDLRATKTKKEIKEIIKNVEKIKGNRSVQLTLIQQAFDEKFRNCEFINDTFIKLVNNTLGISVAVTMSKAEVLKKISDRVRENPVGLAGINDYLISEMRSFISDKNKEFKKIKESGKKSTKYPEVLKICTSMAEGYFSSYAKTKEMLYIFAFAFEMTFFPSEETEEVTDYDFYRDIKKQLFENYYCDNIIRYLHNYQNVGVYEELPGVMIQYKNFVEIVYLYWLNKKYDDLTSEKQPPVKLSPADKLLKAVNMISDIVKKVMDADKLASKDEITDFEEFGKVKNIVAKKDKDTVVYRNYLYGKEYNKVVYNDQDLKVGELLSKTVKDFKKFIINNYDIDLKKAYSGEKSYEGFENQNQQKTARQEYEKYISNIKMYIETENNIDPESFDVGFCTKIENVARLDKKLTDEDIDNFLKLFRKLKETVKNFTLAMNSEDISRTKMMIAHYYDFITVNSEGNYNETFPDFYYEYCEELDYILDISSYQRVNEKNLLDMLLVYSAFIILRS